MKISYFWNLLLVIGMISVINNVPAMKGQQEQFSIYLINLIALMSFQIFGFGFTRNYLTKYWQSDVFSKRTSFLKTMPVRNDQIVLARLIQMLFTIAYMYVLLFVLLGSDGTILTDLQFTGSQLLAFSFVWVGYTLSFSGLYLFFEIGYSGKLYFAACSVLSVAVIAFVVLLSFVAKVSAWNTAAEWVHTIGWGASALSLGFGMLVMAVFVRLTVRRLKRRDYYL